MRRSWHVLFIVVEFTSKVGINHFYLRQIGAKLTIGAFKHFFLLSEFTIVILTTQ